MALPDSLRIELVQEKAANSGTSTDDKIADWAGAVAQLRQIAQWIVGGVIAWVLTIFATTAFAKLGQMSLHRDFERLMLAGLAMVLAIVAVGIVFYFGIRVIAPSGCSLDELAEAKDRSRVHTRLFLFALNNLKLPNEQLGKILESKDDGWDPWIHQMRATLGFALVKTRFDELKTAMVLALILAIPASLAFVWAANPPDGYNATPMEEVTVEYDAAGKLTGHKVTTHQPKLKRRLNEAP